MVLMTRHILNIDHQYVTMRSLKNSLSVNECILHMDFSENYLCKYGQEIQQVHFGASHRQVSLHTSVAYVPVPSMMAQVDAPIANTTQMSLCTISNCLRHDPPAIWAHMDPVFPCIKETCPLIDTVHFVSDGPTSQYRSRKNFYLFSTRSFVTYNLKSATWNFTEASHDKSAADGVGASIKRADLTT